MTTDELNAIVKAVMDELEKAGVDFDFKAETPQADDLVYVMRGTADRYMGITVKWQNLLDIIVQKATEAKNEAVSAKDIALQTLATIQGIESNVSSMKSSVDASEANVASMKAYVETSKANVTQMKSEVSEMKTSVEGTKTEVEGLKSDVTNLKAQTQTIVDNAKKDVTGLLDTKADVTDVGIDLIWERAISSFEPQTISLDLSPYRFIDVVCGFTNDIGNTTFVRRFPIGIKSQIEFTTFLYDKADSVINALNGCYRDINITTTGITFGNGHMIYNGNVYKDWPARCVPYKIYGVK